MTDPVLSAFAAASAESPRDMAESEVLGTREDQGRQVVVIRGPEAAARKLARFLRGVREVRAVERVAGAILALLVAGPVEARNAGGPYSGKLGYVSGVARVIDGDTLELRGRTFRLHGIDAPEADQPGGDLSTEELRRLTGYGPIDCRPLEDDRYGRTVAVCYHGPFNLNAEMVANGWAHAFVRYSRDYLEQERTARAGRFGLWSGPEPIRPWYWRQMRAFDARRAIEERGR